MIDIHDSHETVSKLVLAPYSKVLKLEGSSFIIGPSINVHMYYMIYQYLPNNGFGGECVLAPLPLEEIIFSGRPIGTGLNPQRM